MTKQMMRYKLNADGTIPSFLYLGNDGVGGQWSNTTNAGTSPQDMWLVGISDGSTLPADQAEVINSKEDLVTYLNSYTSTWKQPNPTQVGNLDAQIPFDQQEAANWAWNKLEELNS
jgi:hypothetical protein